MKLQLPSFTKNFHHDVYDAIDPTRAELSLAGKNVLVTGGGQGIGAAITSTFAIAGAANIIILGRTLDTLNAVKSKVESREGNKSKVHVFQADISDETRINQIFDEVVKSVGQVDIYIANAAYLPEPVTVMATQVDDFWRGFEANVKGGFIVARAFLKVASENAVLINVSSGVAHIRYMTPGASYAGSKVAGVRLMDHIAVENPHLRVYNLQPGVIQSGMSHKSGLSWAPGSLDRGMCFPSARHALNHGDTD